MRPPTVRNTEGPISDLFYAVNFYITTGDRIGEGNAAEAEGGELLVIIPLGKTNAYDQADADRLEQRVREIQSAGAVAVTLERHADTGAFDYLLLKLAVKDARLLARELVREMGGKGWGTPKHTIDRHFAGLREKILSGEGV